MVAIWDGVGPLYSDPSPLHLPLFGLFFPYRGGEAFLRRLHCQAWLVAGPSGRNETGPHAPCETPCTSKEEMQHVRQIA